jgi:hypothetical protein
MSSAGSGALTVEWPRWLLADRLTVVLAVACASVIEMVVANYPAVPTGVGLAIGIVLIGAHLLLARNNRALLGARLEPAGRWTLLTRSGEEAARLAPGSRVLGSTVVLRLRTAGGVHQVWLTPHDVSASRLRLLRARLLSAGGGAKA